MSFPFNGTVWTVLDSTGNPVPGAKVYTYDAGTLTAKAAYTTSALTTATSNPIIADSAGRVQFFLGSGSYRIRVFDASDVEITALAVDNVTNQENNLADASDTANGDALIAVKRTEAGSAPTTLHFYVQRSQLRLTDFLTAAECDDIFAGTGSIDVSAKFATACTRAAGGVLILPTGRIRADNMTVTGTRTAIVGAGGRATRISAPTAAQNVFTVNGDFCEIRDVFIDSAVTRSGGWYVDFSASANRSRLSGFSLDGFHGGVRTSAVASLTVERGEMLNGIATNGVGFRVDDGFDVSIRDVIMDAASQIYAGILVFKTGDLTIEDCNVIHGGNALYLNPGSGQVVASVWANNSYFDTSTRGLYALAAGGAIVRTLLDQVWMSGNTIEGAKFATSGGGFIRGVDIDTPHVFSNGTNGISIADSGVKDVHIVGGQIANHAAGSGVSFAANVTSCSVKDSRIGDTGDLAGNLVGIDIATGCTSLVVRGNNLAGNTTALSNNATSSTNEVDENLAANAWLTYTPTVTASSGSYTTLGTVAGKYSRDGKRLTFQLSLPITTNGTAAGAVIATLPTGLTAASDQVIFGRENSSGGAMLQGVILSGQTTISITKYDNTYPGGSGTRMLMGGTLEVQ